jgi:hypothetical protein
MATTDTITPPRARSAPRVLVGVGAAFVLYQAWGYAGWLLAGIPWQRQGDGVPDAVKSSVLRGEVLLVVGALAWIVFLALSSRRRGRPTWPLVLSISWALVYWQESLVNLSERRFTYNPYFLSRGDWIPHLPLSGADEPLLDQPILMESLVFVCLIPAVGLAVAWLLGRAARRTSSVVLLVVIGCLAAALFETAFELAGISQQLLVWNLVPEHLSLFGGTVDQWPMTEFPLGFVWAAPGILWHFRDRFAWLGWLDPTAGPRTGAALAARVLALTALINLAFLVYNVALATVPAATGAAFPAWLDG